MPSPACASTPPPPLITTEAARWDDCAWSDERRGARGAQQARRASDQVETLKRVLYARTRQPAGQQTFAELERRPGTPIVAGPTR